MNLRALRIFVGLMDEGTLTRAASRMHLSQSAASRLLSLLEDELGAPLFRRERRRMVPLPAADRLYPEAQRILAQTASLREVVQSERPSALRVLCQTRLVPGLVVPAIARFIAHGGGPVRLEAAPRRELARRLLVARHDLVVATLPVPVEDWTVEPLGSVPLGILLPPDHPLGGAENVDLADLEGTPYVALDETTVIRRMVDASGATLPAPHVEVSTGSAAYRLVAAGLGFTFADRLAVEPELLDRVALVPWRRSVDVGLGVAATSETPTAPAERLLAALRIVFATSERSSTRASR